MGLVTTSLVVDFGGDAPSMLKAEIDDRTAGLNNGNTSFVTGDSPGFLIYKTSDVTITSKIASLGLVVSAGGTVTIAQEEFLEFSNERSASTNYPVVSGFTYQWFGTNLGTLTVQNQTEVFAATSGVAVAKVTYNTNATLWRLTNVPGSVNGKTNFPVLIYIAGETP